MSQETHLFVLHHGLWGNPNHLNYLVEQLKKAHSTDSVTVLNSEVNQGLLTYDGVDGCGDRQAERVEETVKELEAQGLAVTKISFIGYSMGGLFNRYAVGRLHAKGFFSKHTPYNFVTLASPNLGIRKPEQYVSSRLYHRVVSTLIVRTGSQISLSDDYTGKGEPLLVVMADPRYVYVRALALFRKRMLFANTRNDLMVRYTTAAIEASNPYRKSEPVVVDVDRFPSVVKPRSALPEDELVGVTENMPSEEGTREIRSGKFSLRKRIAGKEPWPPKTLAVISVLMVLSPVLIPLWVVLASSGLNYTRYRFLKMREEKKVSYDATWFEECSANGDGVSPVVELVTPTAKELEVPPSDASDTTTVDPSAEGDRLRDAEEQLDDEYFSQLVRVVPPGALPIAPPPVVKDDGAKVRRWMVDSLNALGWEKVDTSIPFTNAHAAIVVRRLGPYVDAVDLLMRRLIM